MTSDNVVALPTIEVYDQRKVRYTSRERCSEMLPVNILPDKPYKKCDHRATFKVNGKPLCNLHAGRFALEFVLTNQSKVVSNATSTWRRNVLPLPKL